MPLRPVSRWCASIALCAIALSSGCATAPRASASDDGENDPLEPFNRKVFAVNQVIDRNVAKPLAEAYRSTLPEVVRDRIRNFLDNLHEPIVFANDVLQGRGESAGITGRRFIINTTVGVLGLFDRAAEYGNPKQTGDFGQTLYAWGVGDGPYLILPLFGPSNFRDAIGFGVDAYGSPLRHVGSDDTARKVGIATGVTDGIDLRSRNIESLDSIEATSVDFYAYLRSVFRQHRQEALREARAEPDKELVDPGADLAPAATPLPAQR